MSKLKSMTIPIEEIGQTLKDIRTELGLSQLAAGEVAGVTAGTIGNYERDLRGLDILKISQILSAFGMAVTSITFTQVSSLDLDKARAANNPAPGH